MAFNDFIKKVIYGDDNDSEYDQENDSFQQDNEQLNEEQFNAQANYQQSQESAQNTSYGYHQTQNMNMTSGSAIEMKVVKPDNLENVTQIANHLLERKTVLLNLEDTSRETSRRLLDFLNGVAYAINGKLKRVAKFTYVVTPNNVEVSGEQIIDTQEKQEIV